MDERTERDINAQIEKILKEMGLNQPPLNLENVLDFLNVNRAYYSLKDPNLIQEIFHKLRIGARRASEIFEKIDLRGLWLPEQKKILVDQDTPKLKHRWITAHELGHKIIPWHSGFIQGDTAETLEPEYHEIIEAEANYAASSLIFMASRFSKEAVDYEPSIKTVIKLAKIYGNTTTSTLRRLVLHAHDKPMVALILKPHWLNPSENVLDLCRYFIPSGQYISRFSHTSSSTIVRHIVASTSKRIGGPLAGGSLIIPDNNGDLHEFISESFYNRYDILSLVTYLYPYKVIF